MFDRLPQDLYVGLPGISDFHDASTGTSAAFESASTRAPLGLRNNWGSLKEKESKLFKRLQRMGVKIPQEFLNEHSGVWLDNWNWGNREAIKRKGGVKGIDSVKDVITLLEDPKQFDEFKQMARDRSAREFAVNTVAKENLGNKILDILSQQNRRKIRGGTLFSSLGLGLGSLGLNNISSRLLKPVMENKDKIRKLELSKLINQIKHT